MRRVIHRAFLGSLLCAVALTTSGCFLKAVLGGIVVESSEEFDVLVANIFGQTIAAVCEGAPFGGGVECFYGIEGVEGSTISSAELIAEFGLLGLFVDPLILQLPSGVTNISGTIDNPADANPAAPLAITTATSFLSQPGTQIVAEPGHVFVIVDFPASIANS
jgi:hypothetical protein